MDLTSNVRVRIARPTSPVTRLIKPESRNRVVPMRGPRAEAVLPDVIDGGNPFDTTGA